MAPRRRPIVAANWQCAGARLGEIAPFVEDWTTRAVDTKEVEVVLCSAGVHIAFWRVRLQGTGIQVSVQNCSSSSTFVWDDGVAWTAQCLASLGVAWVVLGCADNRRQNETAAEISAKISCAESAGLGIFLCVGERLWLTKEDVRRRMLDGDLPAEELAHWHSEDDALEETDVVGKQLDFCISNISNWENVVIVYQPNPEESSQKSVDHAAKMHAFIYKYICEELSTEVAERLRIQYGGPVFMGNCRRFLEKEHVDGFLINDLSLKQSFADLAIATQMIGDSSATRVQAPEFKLNPILERGCYRRHSINPVLPMFDVDLYDEQDKVVQCNLQSYYELCRDVDYMMVTTSSFGNWRKQKKKNSGGKVIPAISSANSNERVRVLFFDDNISMLLGGCTSTMGICNLRDIATGEYVDFSEGVNGFKYEHLARHTTVASSSEYQAVLIQVNILDAMVDGDYFMKIVEQYTQPDEKLILYMDVNGTIVWDDSMAGKGIAEVLLSTLFRLAEFRPGQPSTSFTYDGQSIDVKKNTLLKELVREIYDKRPIDYKHFWTPETCVHFIRALLDVGTVGWLGNQGTFTPDYFSKLFAEYVDELKTQVSADGIPNSWFKLYKEMKKRGHSIIVNSFGMDTRRVVLRSVDDERYVVQVSINYKDWGGRDKTAYVDTYSD